MDKMYEKKLNEFIYKVQNEYSSYYGNKTDKLFLLANKKRAQITKFFDQELKQKNIMIKFNSGQGRIAANPWIEITKKDNDSSNPFICIIFSKESKTPYITLQIEIHNKKNYVISQLRDEYQKELEKEFSQKSQMNLESKSGSGYKYQHYANIYSQKYQQISQITKFIDIMKKRKHGIENFDQTHIDKINQNQDVAINLVVKNDYNQERYGYNRLAKISYKVWRESLRDSHQKCAICPYNYKRFLQTIHIKNFKNSSSEDKMNLHNGLVFCPNDYWLYKHKIILLKQDIDSLVFKVNHKYEDEIKQYAKFYKNLFNEDNNSIEVKIPHTYNIKKLQPFIES